MNDRQLIARLPSAPPLRRVDLTAMGIQIPASDNPACFVGHETTFCLGGWHWQVYPADACWRLRHVAVSGSAEHPVYSCRCAEWRPGEPYPPKGHCAYRGQWFAIGRCPRRHELNHLQMLTAQQALIDKEAKEKAREGALSALIEQRAHEFSGAELREIRAELEALRAQRGDRGQPGLQEAIVRRAAHDSDLRPIGDTLREVRL